MTSHVSIYQQQRISAVKTSSNRRLKVCCSKQVCQYVPYFDYFRPMLFFEVVYSVAHLENVHEGLFSLPFRFTFYLSMLCDKCSLHICYHFRRKLFQTLFGIKDKAKKLIFEYFTFLLERYWWKFFGVLEIDEELLYCNKLALILLGWFF